MAKKILVAEDDSAIRRLVVECLGRRGHEVAEAADGVQACAFAESGKPDLILLDLLLPRRDGYTVLLFLRSRPESRDVPILLLSGEPPEEQGEVARTLGADGYLPKPFTPSGLTQAVEEALQRKPAGTEAR
jgi:CheY-like chemotaxis protein